MLKEKLFRGALIIYIVCISFLIGLIVHKFTLHSKPMARPTISVHGLDVTEQTSPEELVNHIYQWIQLDSDRSKSIFADGMPILGEEKSRTNIVDLVVNPQIFLEKVIQLTVGIQYGRPQTYVSSSIPKLEEYKEQATQVATVENQPEIASSKKNQGLKTIIGESGKIYLGIPKEEMLHYKIAGQDVKSQSKPDLEEGGQQNPSTNTQGSERVVEQGENSNTSGNVVQVGKVKPRILIYHTHTTETYLDDTSPQDQQGHVFLPNKGKIVDVGASMAKKLEEYGFDVYHDRTNYMEDGISRAYDRSYVGVSASVKKEHFDIVLDLHRDGTGLERKGDLPRDQYVAEINGKPAARVLLLISLGKEGYFKTEEELNRVYPNRKDNYTFAAALAAHLQEVYPGLLRRLEPTKRRLYNQHVHRHALLVEVGFETNTIAEAVYTGELLADVLAELYTDAPASVLINQ